MIITREIPGNREPGKRVGSFVGDRIEYILVPVTSQRS